MKQINNEISEFLDWFDLHQTDSGICFDAKVIIKTKKLFAEVESEVHIVTFGGYMDIIYFLGHNIELKGFPDRFESGNVDFAFGQDHGLIIHGSAPGYGHYDLAIQPLDKNCIESTLAEISAKTYN